MSPPNGTPKRSAIHGEYGLAVTAPHTNCQLAVSRALHEGPKYRHSLGTERSCPCTQIAVSAEAPPNAPNGCIYSSRLLHLGGPMCKMLESGYWQRGLVLKPNVFGSVQQ